MPVLDPPVAAVSNVPTYIRYRRDVRGHILTFLPIRRGHSRAPTVRRASQLYRLILMRSTIAESRRELNSRGRFRRGSPCHFRILIVTLYLSIHAMRSFDTTKWRIFNYVSPVNFFFFYNNHKFFIFFQFFFFQVTFIFLRVRTTRV